MEFNENNTKFVEETLTGLIKNGLFHLNSVNDIIEEMGNDPKMIKIWVDSAQKISDLLDKLMKLEQLKSSKQLDKSKFHATDGTSPKSVTNNLILMSPDEVLSKIETSMGLASIEDIKGS
jgi:hypothetical protein